MKRPTLDSSFYFITCPTFLHQPILTDIYKEVLLINILENAKKLGSIYAYSIAVNHYHILIYLQNGDLLAKLMQKINGKTSFQINKLKNGSERTWGTYWSNIIFDNTVCYKVLGYIAGNLLKHKEALNFEELYNSKFSSYKYLVKQRGEENARAMIQEVINLDIMEDGVNIEEFFKSRLKS
ncbi:transposase, partial [Patescibacteria group bacterium]|nr:transposase [Patescibacteria group bacterium]